MLIPSTSELVETSWSVSGASRGNISRISQAAAVRSLAPGECLFQKGDRYARLYRVEHGALCHYVHKGDGSHEIIEFVFKGDIVGFAQHVEKHITTARALVLTEVSVVPSQVFADALKTDGCLAARVAAAADREFDYLRSRAVQSGEGRPAARVAAFIAALVRISTREGRDPSLVADEISSGVVAEGLNMSIDCLATALMELERRGLIQQTPAGKRIVDVELLERLFD